MGGGPLNLGDALAVTNKWLGAKMLIIRPEQMDQMARGIFIGKLDAAFSRDVPGFAELDKDDRTEFLKQSILAAESKGFKTEQGIASYSLAVWWLGLDFECSSEVLKALLESDYPEVRKAHAMNEWVQAAIGNPDNIATADKKLKQALAVTGAWGK